MKKYFVTSDTHGFYSTLKSSLLAKGFEEDNPNHILIICGDLFDRGLEAPQMLKFVKSLYKQNRFIYIRGNHEDLINDLYEEILKGYSISRYHISNKTVQTLCQFLNKYPEIVKKLNYGMRLNSEDLILFKKKIRPILNWINKISIDYYELKNYIFVHGWIPCSWEENFYGGKVNIKPLSKERWGKTFLWDEARWLNGMECQKNGATIPNHTIICGHWHCSWGWSHIRQERKEFPAKNRKDWEKSFEPFIDEGIIALDACTAYSGIINILVIED